MLKKGERTVSKTDFKISNDGGPIAEWVWNVTWYDDYVEIILSGEEQYDELVELYYDGKVERQWLTTRGGVGKEYAGSSDLEDVTDTEEDMEHELFLEEQQINAGYKAIYERYSDSSTDHFEVCYGASESSSKCILSEDENTIEYLIYNGKSENEKCGLYVQYQSEKNANGTWSDADGTIVDI